MKRSEIRYAIFRVRAGTPDEKQQAIFDSYADQLSEFGFTAEDFTKEWDIDKNDFSQIVTGKIARSYNRDVPIVIPPK